MYELKYYRTDHGEKCVLVGPRGRKLLPILMIEGNGLTVRKVPLSEERYLRDVKDERKRRTLGGIVRQYRAIGRRSGMTKAAKTFLTQASKAA